MPQLENRMETKKHTKGGWAASRHDFALLAHSSVQPFIVQLRSSKSYLGHALEEYWLFARSFAIGKRAHGLC